MAKPVEVVLANWRDEQPDVHLAERDAQRTKCNRSILLYGIRRPGNLRLDMCTACEIIYGLEQLGWSFSPSSRSSRRSSR
jgi:hypothetical protein